MTTSDIYKALQYNDLDCKAIKKIQKTKKGYVVYFDCSTGGAIIPTDIRNRRRDLPGYWLYSVEYIPDAMEYKATYKQCEN